MKLQIAGKNMDVGQALQEHVESALTARVKKYFSNPVDGQVTITKDRHHAHRFHADINVHAGRGVIARANSTTDDPYHVVDTAIATLEKNLRRYKGRLQDHHNRLPQHPELLAAEYVLGREGAAPARAEAEPATAPGDADQEAEQEEPGPAVVAESSTSIPTLSVRDAVMRLDLLGQTVLMFRNAAHGGLSVVYHRTDGNIGWIDPAEQQGRADPS